jgi:hypothetical protein
VRQVANLLEVEGDDAMMLEYVLAYFGAYRFDLADFHNLRLCFIQGVQQPHRLVLGLRVWKRFPEAPRDGGRLVACALSVAACRPASGAGILPEECQHQHSAVVLRKATSSQAACIWQSGSQMIQQRTQKINELLFDQRTDVFRKSEK